MLSLFCLCCIVSIITDGFPILINVILNGNLIKTHRNVKAYRPILVDIHRFSV